MSAFQALPQGRFSHSLRSNFLLLSSLGIIAIVLMGIFMANMGRSILLEAEVQQLAETSTIIKLVLERADSDAETLELIGTLKQDTRFRFTLIAPDGSVLADSDANAQYMENHARRPEVQAALKGKIHFETRFSHTLNQDMLYYARPLGERVLRVAMPLYAIADLLSSFLKVVAWVVGGATLIMVVVSWRMYRGIIIPVKRILLAAQVWESGGNALIYHVSKPSELAGIFRSLRQLAQELHRRIVESNSREQELQRLFEAIREPVLVIDHNQVIKSLNPAALEFIRQLDPAADTLLGAHLLTYIRSSELAALVQESGKADAARSARITLYGRANWEFGAYAAPLAPMDAEGGQLLILVLYLEKSA